MIIAPFFNVCYEDVRVLLTSYDVEAVPNSDRFFLFSQISDMLWTVWLPSLAFESLIFVLTISKAIDEARRHVYSPISSILYRDGILYFLAISGEFPFVSITSSIFSFLVRAAYGKTFQPHNLSSDF